MKLLIQYLKYSFSFTLLSHWTLWLKNYSQLCPLKTIPIFLISLMENSEKNEDKTQKILWFWIFFLCFSLENRNLLSSGHFDGRKEMRKRRRKLTEQRTFSYFVFRIRKIYEPFKSLMKISHHHFFTPFHCLSISNSIQKWEARKGHWKAAERD